jgi:hypothetical protein
MSASPEASKAVALSRQKTQSMVTDEFLYFFLRLRKGEVKRVVQRVKSLYPEESPEQLARRLVNTQSVLSFVGGSLLHLPQLIPVAGTAWKFAGFAGGASVVTRMHLYLILEIALLFEQDIEDKARVPEIIAVIGASSLAAASPFLVSKMNWNPLAAIPASGAAATLITQAIGAEAIRLYKKKQARDRRLQAQAEASLAMEPPAA